MGQEHADFIGQAFDFAMNAKQGRAGVLTALELAGREYPAFSAFAPDAIEFVQALEPAPRDQARATIVGWAMAWAPAVQATPAKQGEQDPGQAQPGDNVDEQLMATGDDAPAAPAIAPPVVPTAMNVDGQAATITNQQAQQAAESMAAVANAAVAMGLLTPPGAPVAALPSDGLAGIALSPEELARVKDEIAPRTVTTVRRGTRGNKAATTPAAAASTPAPSPPADPRPQSTPAPKGEAPSGNEGAADAQRLDAAREAALKEAPESVDNVYKNCVWLRIRFRRLGVSRDASDDVQVTDREGEDATPKTRTTKRILQGCKEWRSIEAADNAFRLRIRAMAVPSQLTGIYPITTDMMETAEKEVAAYESVRADGVRAFALSYPEAVEADRQPDALGALWNAQDYPPPNQVANAYRMAATWVDMSQSTRLTAAMAARNAKAAAEEQREAFAEVRAALRVQVSMMLDELIALLKPDEQTGQRRGFSDARVSKLREWCALLPMRDVTNDGQLRQIADNVKGILDGLDVAAVRSDANWRDTIAAKLDASRTELRTLGVGDAPARRFKRAKKPAQAGASSQPQAQ